MNREIGFVLVLLCGCATTEVTPETGTETADGDTGGTMTGPDSESSPPSTSATNGMTGASSGSSGDAGTGSSDGGSDGTTSGSIPTSSATTDDMTTTDDATTTSGVVDDDGGSSSTDGFEDAGSGTDGVAQVQISGVVRAGVAPGDDGIGTVYIGVRPAFDCFDGTTQFNDVIAAADLSVIGNEVAFSITADLVELSDDEALQVFLDDDLNAADDNDPDPNDMIIGPTEDKELAGCFSLGDVDDDVSDLVVVLDDIY